MTPLEIRPLVPADIAECEAILRSLPDWFGIEESLAQYVRDLERFPGYVIIASGELVGFLAVRRHFPASAEIHVIAVRAGHHRRGVGRELVEHAAALLRADGVTLLQVKTLGPSRPSPHYARTRLFYESLGFVPLEENDLWGPVNPCLILVRPLARPN